MSQLQITHIMAHLDNEHSGPTYSVQKLTEGISAYSNNCELLFLDRGKPKIKLANSNTIGFKQSVFFPKIGRSPKMKKYVNDICGPAVCHSHGLWMMPNIYHKNAGPNILKVLSPRGTLNPSTLKFSSITKKIMWMALQKKAFHKSDALHATSYDELEDFRRLGFNKPIIMLPNGIDVQPREMLRVHSNATNGKLLKAIFIGRIHEKKGLELLLETWAKLDTSLWELRIYGTGKDNYVNKIKNDIMKLNLKNVSVEKPVYGNEKIDTYLRSNLFILPSQNENFGNVVTEALACGIPVLTTDETPWKILNQKKAGWCVGREDEVFRNCLGQVLHMSPKDLNDCGLRGYLLAKEAYGWDYISKKMVHAYNCLLNKSPMPDYVHR